MRAQLGRLEGPVQHKNERAVPPGQPVPLVVERLAELALETIEIGRVAAGLDGRPDLLEQFLLRASGELRPPLHDRHGHGHLAHFKRAARGVGQLGQR
ncbi:MAG: hypothetical protein ACK56I_20310, partial [bacterium]